MYYVIQKNVFKETNYNLIFSTLEKLGLEYEVVDCLPFVEDIEFKTDRKDVFPFGSVKMSRLSTKYNWNPGSFYGGNHDFSIYSKYYGENLLNYDSFICKFGDIIDWLPNETKFIRPCKDSKTFTGRVFSKMKWDDFVTYSLTNGHTTSLDINTLIQVASPKKIYKEARLWIVDGKIVTSSYYFFHGNISYQEDVEPEGLEFGQLMVDKFQVADAFVMDICLTPDGWKIVEINCINCSGFYKGDLQKIVIALENKFNPISGSYINDHLMSELKTSSPMIFTSYETNKELDLDKMFNHLGPEVAFALGNKLIDLANDDYYNAINNK